MTNPTHYSVVRSTAKSVLIAMIVLCSAAPEATAHRFNERWKHTAIDGSGLKQGDPTTLTWGFVADGTPLSGGGTTTVANSEFISFMDGIYEETSTSSDYTQRAWFPAFEDSFERWAVLSGMSYVYEPNDDGVLHAAQNFNILTRGFPGVRADIRIAGTPNDGPSGILAFNFFPDNGDMSFDTDDSEFFADPTGLFNVILHEHGHGLGFNHVDSYDPDTPFEGGGEFLMEPFINTNFTGPQFDDILAIHRGYGDVYEKSNGGNGNDTFANATSLGTLGNGKTLTIGADARPDPETLLPRPVEPEDVDFISIDGLSDSDYLAFEITEAAALNITLTPLGPVYPEAAQGGIPVPYDTSSFSNLSLQLFDVDGTSQLASDNSGLAGEMDVITFEPTAPGTYYVRVQGEVDDIQMYELNVSLALGQIDFNDDGFADCSDVNQLVAEIVSATNDPDFDLDGNGLVDRDDLTQWLAESGDGNGLGEPYALGDANLDGTIDDTDFGLWSDNRFTHKSAFCLGDFNADGFVDVSDYNLWSASRIEQVAPESVPEAGASQMLLAAMLMLGGWMRRRVG